MGSTPMGTKNDPANSGTSFAGQTALTDLFGDHPKTKILSVLLSESRDVNVSHIAEQAGMSRSTVYKHIDDLIGLNVVSQTRSVGGSPMYQIDRDSETAKQLAKLEWSLVDEYEE
jgi:DNA-binding transcriptional ArsR family regulator